LPGGKAGKARAVHYKENAGKSFDKLRTNGKSLIPFVVSLSNHEWNQRFPGCEVEPPAAARPVG